MKKDTDIKKSVNTKYDAKAITHINGSECTVFGDCERCMESQDIGKCMKIYGTLRGNSTANKKSWICR